MKNDLVIKILIKMIYKNMEDESWIFFCNNSPRLVKKYRPRTPVDFISYNKDNDKNNQHYNNLSKSKLFQKAEIMKTNIRLIYRDKTPTPLIRKTNSKTVIRPAHEVAAKIYKNISKKKLSPLRSTKTSEINIKKESIRVIRKAL